MTAFDPLLSKVFKQTILRKGVKEYIGIISTLSDRGSSKQQSILYENYLKVYEFKMVNPSSDKMLNRGDILTVVQTQSNLVKIGEYLRLIDIGDSSVVNITELIGSKLILGIDINNFMEDI